MLDPIVNFFTRIFQWIGRGIGFVVGIILWPFLWAGRWYTQRGWILKSILGLALVVLVGLYAYFFWVTQRWTNFNPDYVVAYDLSGRATSAGEEAPPVAGAAATAGAGKTCTRSAITDVTADLIDFNVNQNAWVPSMILSKAGFFGVPWRHTPFFDNKAAFQLGVNQAIRRTAIELVDTLGRVRGTSQIDQDLQDARGAVTFDEETWYFGISPFGPKTPTPSFYRSAIGNLRAFNQRLEACNATFDARADNLVTFLDRIASDIGSTSDMLRIRSEEYNSGWFDTRADDRFWFAYGQLYAYYGIIHASRADFQEVIATRGLTPLWNRSEERLRAALNIMPFIISNGNESGWIMPAHLATMGFYVLGARANLVELRSVLDR
ncbi:MAG: DUF2333 family protein [Alphaproteobacteria bacterium]|jgi:hypothetical protein|nr:DUF2333 family protein [Alphaproteobacteria bacterium]MBU0803025.1 DUF2333 family protein [Alphaproteobacteria bacterium]MBU0870864.1 DUF2333 family protein [Alphaproteobacteria bacterium]MBU1403699.1 DUF2333 family protein [Alphaproteobacteria bacterium]MBU1589534.1 DUF2333 family protein [Alphaproteobacteria bacterium]